MRLPAFELTQKGKKIYLSYASAQNLSQWLSGRTASMKADIWDKETNPDGYQRKPDSDKIRSIEEFLRGKRGVEPLMPASIVLNLRAEKVRFDVEDDQQRYGILSIEDEAGALWEVDGQHRLRGVVKALADAPRMEQTKLRDYCLPLTIIVSLPKPDEALQFVAINTTQTKVKPELSLRILWSRYKEKAQAAERFLKGQTWKIDAIEIVDSLNRDQASPFFDSIAAPGGSLKGKIVTEGMFVSSLEPLARVRNRFLNQNFVKTYWKSIATVFPHASAPDKRTSYGVLRNVGPYVFHKVAPLIALWCEDQLGGANASEMTQALTVVKKYFPERFWLRRGGKVGDYSSRRGYNTLAARMMLAFLGLSPPKIPTVAPKLEDRAHTLLTLHLFREYSRTEVKKWVPDGPGTYVLFRFRDKAVYVGMDGEDIQRRLLQHSKQDPNIFAFKATGEGGASELERYLWHSLIAVSGWKIKNKRHPESHGGRRCPVCGKV